MNAPDPLPHEPLLSADALAAHWMPFTGNRDFKARPRLITAARGAYYRTHDVTVTPPAPAASAVFINGSPSSVAFGSNVTVSAQLARAAPHQVGVR